jgi:hypothetical protein
MESNDVTYNNDQTHSSEAEALRNQPTPAEIIA